MISMGIMHGRLSPPFEGRFQAFPADSWQEEFFRAQEAGLTCIEWIFEVPHADDNPLSSDAGIHKLLKLSEETGVAVRSLCADYYMDALLVTEGAPVAENIDHLTWLISRAALLNILYIVLPFVDRSSLRSAQDRAALHEVLEKLLPVAQTAGVELHLETDLNPTEFGHLLARHNHPCLRANHDMGNSASLGFHPSEELAILGPWLGSVHVKDRVLGGGTVPLGQGAVDFPACFRAIQAAGFDRWFILQAARGDDGQEVALAQANQRFVEAHWHALMHPPNGGEGIEP